MSLSRRMFLMGCAGLGAGFLLKHCAGNVRKPDFQNLDEEHLPQEFSKMGFQIGKYNDKKTDRQLLIIGEDHEVVGTQKDESKFIDFLIDHYDADSLGLEGLCGPPTSTIDEQTTKDFAEYSKGLDPDVIGIESFSQSAFLKYVKQASIPCYGIEDRNLQFKAVTLVTFMTALAIVQKKLFDFHIPYSKIANIEKIERFVDDVRKKFPEEGFPPGTLMELINSRPLRKDVEDFSRKVAYNLIDLRNSACGININKYLQELNSKRGILVIGLFHVKHPYNRTNIQEYISVSSRIVEAPNS